MNVRTSKSTIRILAASAAIGAAVLAAPAVGSAGPERAPAPRAQPATRRDAVDAAALAAFARAHHLSGLSPASLAPVPVACSGLSPASAHGCAADVFTGEG